MKIILKLVASLFLVFVMLVIWLVGFGGNMPWTHKIVEGKLEVVGVKCDAEGGVLEKIYRKVSTSTVGVLFTPEGPRTSVKYKTEFYFGQNDQPPVILPFLSENEFRYFERVEGKVQSDLQFCDKFVPVTNSVLWIAAGSDPVGNYLGGNDFHVVVFDVNHLFTSRTFSMKMDIEKPDSGFEFLDGNSVIKIETTLGFVQKYDVLKDRVADLK